MRDQHAGGAARFTASRSSAITCAAAVGIEVARRLVGEHERGPVDERARDGDALQLAARELAGQAAPRSSRPTAASIARDARAPRVGARAPSSASGSATFCATVR